MLLKDSLQNCTREDLIGHAKRFHIKKYSKMKKDELVDQIVSYFCRKEVIKNRITCLTEEQFTIFCKACNTPVGLTKKEAVDGIQMYIRRP